MSCQQHMTTFRWRLGKITGDTQLVELEMGGKTADSVLETGSWKKDCDTGSEKRSGHSDDTMLRDHWLKN